MWLMWNDNFCIVLGVSYQEKLAFVIFFLIDPHSLFSAYEILMFVI